MTGDRAFAYDQASTRMIASARNLDLEAPHDAAPNDGARYRLLEKLGAGGMGAVYRAEDRTLGRIVAQKQLHSSLAGPKRRMVEALFEREYHTLVRLKHPRIIEVYDYGFTPDGPYYTMELLDGKDLQQLAPLPVRDACRILREVASSLALIHAHRFVHRDVTARNVRLTSDGRAKLIDFGALATFGQGLEIIGTPTYMAPEALRRLTLDQRTDLFALGAVGYWALTGQHAYPARRVEELPRMWQRAPRRLSEIVPDIPQALETLIMSLLSIDPLSRPASAAAVIDQLTAIADLEPEEHQQAVESYLLSGRMVGREREMHWLQRRLTRALEGRGAEILVMGPAGIGKTRLLHEICLDAQLRGAMALKADAQASPGPFGVAATLALELLRSCPEVARPLAEPYASLLSHLSPELKALLQLPELEPLEADPAERRARFQSMLHEWFVQVANQRTLLLAVDNLQAADDNSAAFLAAFGVEARQTRLVVLATQRAGDDIVAPVPVRLLRKRSAHLKLGSLTAAGCEELVGSIFGDTPNAGRLAKLLHEKSAGNPQQLMDLAQLLVKRGIARYAGGTWVLPEEVASEELPNRSEEILAARLSLLGEHSRALAEALSIHGKPVSIERCVALAEGLGEDETYLALDELVAEQILLLESGSYRFSQAALRDAVLGQMNDARRRVLHLRAAEALLASTEGSIGSRVEAAWHLLRAGEDARGADIMANASREFLKQEGVHDSAEQITQALDTAITVYDKQHRSDYEIAGLLFPLIPLAFFVDWRLTLKHAQRTIELGLKVTGLGLAHKLRRVLGRKLGLTVALLIASIRFKRQRKRGLKYDLREAIGSLCGLVPSTVAIRNICYDLAGVKSTIAMFEPLEMFGPDHLAAVFYDWGRGQLLMGQSREHEAIEFFEKLKQRFQGPQSRAALSESRWKAVYGGMLFSLGILHAFTFGDRALQIADEMDSIGIRVWSTGAEQIRMLYHALRGESEAVQRHRERVELFAVQGSSTWQGEIFWPVLLLTGDVMARDTIAVRRIWEQLSRRARDHHSLEIYADAAHAAYLSLRGELSAAITLYEEILPGLEPRTRVAWHTVRAFFAETLNLAGKHAQAKQVALEILAHIKPEEYVVVGRHLEPQRQLALADAGLGDYQSAIERLDGLIARHGHEDQPLLIGLLHKARAEVALRAQDVAAFETHLAEMEKRFRATNNPALVAQCERLGEAGERAGLRRALVVSLSADSEGNAERARTLAQRTLSELSGSADRYDYALRLLVQKSRAKAGWLYLLDGERLELAAASSPDEPPSGFEERLLDQIKRSFFEAEEEQDEHTVAVDAASFEAPTMIEQHRPDPKTTFVESARPAASGLFHLVVLQPRRGDERHAIGGVILEFTPRQGHALDPDFIDAIAAALDRGEVTGAVSSTAVS